MSLEEQNSIQEIVQRTVAELGGVRRPTVKQKPRGWDVGDVGWQEAELLKAVSGAVLAALPEHAGDEASDTIFARALEPLPALVKLLVSPWATDTTVVDLESIESAVKLGASLLGSGTKPDWFLSIGFGVSDNTDIALRVPAYVGPIIMLLNEVKSHKSAYLRQRFDPSIRVFSGANLAHLSRADKRVAVAHSLYCFLFIDEFLRKYQPNCIEEDLLRYELFRVANETVVQAADLADELLKSEDDSARTLINVVADGFGQRHGAKRDDSVLYAAFHSFLFLDWGASSEAPPFAGVSYGGKPERAFNIGRRAVLEFQKRAGLPGLHFPHSVQVAALKLFKHAPYYLHSDDVTVAGSAGSPQWRSLYDTARASKEVGRDYAALEGWCDASTLEQACRDFTASFPHALLDDLETLARAMLGASIAGRLEPGLRLFLEGVAGGTTVV